MASWWQKTLAALPTRVTALTGLAGAGYDLLMRRPVPQIKGKLHLQGLHAPVDVITDRYGVPHIYAENEDDLYFAQGYVHAQERLWQMEFNRRLGSGRLSELFGDVTLEVDRFCRRLGIHRAAIDDVEQLAEQSEYILEAYANGVNAYIERNRRALSIEFKLLHFIPAPWQTSDSLQWAKLMGWGESSNWETEIIRARIVAKVGAECAAKLEAGYDPGHPLIIPPGVEYNGINLGMLEQYEAIKQVSGLGMMGASNSWVVDGSMTATGSPILCNDPHLGQAAPSIWYECHLITGDMDVIGASFPGTPGIIIGHNEQIAWGLTNAISDIEDLYVEKFHPQNPHQYEFQGRWENAQIIREEINVKGRKSPVIEEVRITRHGPILTNMPAATHESASTLPLALRWTGLEHCNILTAVLKMNRASTCEEFRDALRDWDMPPQNIIYADREGNVGYVMAGAIPIRAKGQGLLPSPGWTGEYEWTGFIPFDELPQTYNPAQHFIVTANNRVVNDEYPYYITNEWLNGYRAQRICDLLTSTAAVKKLTLADMASIQADQYALPAVEIVPHLVNIATEAPLELAAQSLLRAWDYILTPASAGAAIYATCLNKLERIVFSAILEGDESLVSSYLGTGLTPLFPINRYISRSRPLLIRLLNSRDDSWFADTAMPDGPRTWDAALSRAFHAAIEELRAKLGDDVARWTYGALHKMTHVHVLGLVKPLNHVFNRGPFPVGGDIDTVNMGATSPNHPEVVIAVPSYRQIVSLADMNTSLSGHTPGQSGHVASKHYDDFIKPWLKVQHHPMLFERRTIDTNSEGTLRLLPR
jgi:penicillin G amidase